MISTQNLSGMPTVQRLKLLMKSLAVLDELLCDCADWIRTYRYYDHWTPNTSLASMQDGSGNHYFCLFTPEGAILKGFDHESSLSPFIFNPPIIWPGVLESVPKQFSDFLTQPAFAMLETTFCIWRLNDDEYWQKGNVLLLNGKLPDGSIELLGLLDGNPVTYQTWAEAYFERRIDLETIISIYPA